MYRYVRGDTFTAGEAKEPRVFTVHHPNLKESQPKSEKKRPSGQKQEEAVQVAR